MNKKFLALIGLIVVLAVFAYWLKLPKNEARIKIDWPSQAKEKTTFEVPIYLDTQKSANAAEIHLEFPADLISIKEIKKESSVFELWVTNSPSYSNELGKISLEGGSPNPGFMGKNLLIATLVIEAKARGKGKVVLLPQSRILANDGLGTLIKSSYREVFFQIE